MTQHAKSRTLPCSKPYQMRSYNKLCCNINAWLGPLGQLVASLIVDPGVMSFIPASPHTFLEIYHEMLSTVILLLPLIQEGLLSDIYKRKYVQ